MPVDTLRWNQQFKPVVTVSLPVIATGIIAKLAQPDCQIYLSEKKERFNAFDVARFAPAAVMIGMKAMGVESRSSWGRMLTADAFSAFLAVGVVEGLKKTTSGMRPNGIDDNTFPSGHAAIAFMTATMMAREYGWKSPWYTVGAYSIASATGISRIINNNHWAGDVIAGAGIGILSTQLGYFISDLIFKNRGVNPDVYGKLCDENDDKKFKMNLSSGIAIPLGNIKIGDTKLSMSQGVDASLGGSYRFCGNVGWQANVDMQSLSLYSDNNSHDYLSPLTSMSVTTGPSFVFPLNKKLELGGELGVGYSQYFRLKECYDLIASESTSFAGSFRLGVRYMLLDSTSVSAYCGYQCSRAGLSVLADDIEFGLYKGTAKKRIHALSLGLALSFGI